MTQPCYCLLPHAALLLPTTQGCFRFSGGQGLAVQAAITFKAIKFELPEDLLASAAAAETEVASRGPGEEALHDGAAAEDDDVEDDAGEEGGDLLGELGAGRARGGPPQPSFGGMLRVLGAGGVVVLQSCRLRCGRNGPALCVERGATCELDGCVLVGSGLGR